MASVLFTTSVLALITFGCDAARILAYYPCPCTSHQVALRPLSRELARRGHEVVVITPAPEFPKGQAPGNLTEIDVSQKQDAKWRDVWSEKVFAQSEYSQWQYFYEFHNEEIEKHLSSDEVQAMFKDNTTKFDLLLLECWLRQPLALSHIYNVPVIQVCSFPGLFSSETLGAPIHPFLFPRLVQRRSYNLSVWDKVYSAYKNFFLERMYYGYEEVENRMLQKVIDPNIPPLSKLEENIDMLLLTISPIFQGNYPMPPSVVHIGGIEAIKEKPLPKDLKNYLDNSKRGVVYMSFGSNVLPSYLPKKTVDVIIQTLSELPYDVLWKWDADELPGHPENIRISKWLPQADLLRHPNVKVFITQGGLQSTDEALIGGVPFVGIPILGDQWFNTERYVKHGVGVQLDIFKLTVDGFKKSIINVIEDPSYRNNVKKLHRLIQDQPEPPLDRAVWWTEYVLRNGGAKHLRSPSAHVPFLKYIELDLILLALVLLVCTFYVIKKIVSLIWSSIKLKVKVKIN